MRILILLSLLVPISTRAQQPLEVRHIVDGTFFPEQVRRVNWMNDGGFYTALKNNKVQQYDISTGELVKVMVDGDALDINIDDYQFSEDERRILLLTNRQSIYRRSFVGLYYAYDLETNKMLGQISEQPCSYATFNSTGSKIAYAQQNDLYVTELGSETVQVTSDGSFNEIINGTADWVYEEELYLTKAFSWSPDDRYLAYIKFDESDVREYNLQYWNDGDLYPSDYRYKYPKAGEVNASVEVWVHDTSSGQSRKASIGDEEDIYIPRLSWTPGGLLSIQKLNRWQNERALIHVDVAQGQSKEILKETSETYVHLTFCDDLRYLSKDRFLYSSEKDGHKHFYLYQNDGQLINQVTSGDWDAERLVGLDTKREILYFTSTETSPMERQLFKIKLDGIGKENLSETPGMHRFDMSPDTQYYMDFFSSADTPLKVQLYETRRGRMIKELEDNLDLAKKAQKFGLQGKEFFTLENAEGVVLHGYYIKPPGFDESNEYPLLLYQYSGPGSQNVTNGWGGSHFIWHQLLAQKGYIVAVMDPRGTGGRGEDFKKMTYLQLGKYEAEDHIFAANYFGNLPFVDDSRIGIWGWSYGGYISSLAMFRGEGAFKAAIAVAPVTSWRYYDTIYTERYLRRPQDNPDGYDENSPLSHADKLEGEFLLIHGTGDDNVHFSNSVALQQRLIKSRKQFQSFYYPDQAHGLMGPGRRFHLYEMMTRFIMDRL